MSSYLRGTRILAAHSGSRRNLDVIGGTRSVTKFKAIGTAGTSDDDIIGADKIYTDSATVTQVQTQLHRLSLAVHNPSLDPGKIDGKVGPNTNAAVAAFNTAYGWPSDGGNISAGTLEALKRPDVVNPSSAIAQQAADSADAASTPTQVQAAAAQLSLLTGIGSPTIQNAIAAAQSAALSARTPDEVADAKVKVKSAARAAQGTPWATYAFVGAGSVALLGTLAVVLLHGRKSRR